MLSIKNGIKNIINKNKQATDNKMKKLLEKIYPYHHTIQLGSFRISWTKKTKWLSLEINEKGIYIIY